MSDVDTRTTDIVISNRMGNFDKADALKDYRKRTKFIKVALDLKDKELSETKIKDLPKLMAKAQDEVTVGKMDRLLNEETIVESGFLRGLANFFSSLRSPRLKPVRSRRYSAIDDD